MIAPAPRLRLAPTARPAPGTGPASSPRPAPTIVRTSLLTGALLAGVAVAGVALGGCSGDARADDALQAESGERSGATATNGRVINVEVLPLVEGDFREEIRLTGVVRAHRDVTLAAEEAGVVREVLVERGRRVEAGTPLVRIDDRILRAQLREAEARTALAGEAWERRRRLFETDGVGSELQYLEARFQFEQAEAMAETLRERVARTVVTAPFSGVLEDRMVEVGSTLSPGSPVARLVEVNPVRVSAGVPERFAGEIRVGAPARITFDVLPDQVFEGSVRYVGATVSPRNRTFEAEVLLPNPGGVAKPEMVANVEILRQTREGVVVVPQYALIRAEEGFVAFVVEGEGDGATTARVRPVRLGTAQRNRVVVEAGLEPGDRLVVVGQQQVADGDRVRVVGTREEGE